MNAKITRMCMLIGFTLMLGCGAAVQQQVDSTKKLIDKYAGMIQGAAWVDGQAGKALQFNGTDNYVKIPDNTDLTLAAAGTIQAWIYTAAYRPFAGIVHKGENTDFSDESYTLQFWTPEGKIIVSIVNEAGARIMLVSNAAVALNQWCHVAATWDSGEVRLYINGVLDNSCVNTIGMVKHSDGGLIIGSQLATQYSEEWKILGFEGIIDEVEIYDTALTAAEISEYYNDTSE
ncbi:MAG: LamG domain-containing protein [Spirochaetes bacterium]|nr:LamG domain-containing protein [Spirochaetota bacterium]